MTLLIVILTEAILFSIGLLAVGTYSVLTEVLINRLAIAGPATGIIGIIIAAILIILAGIASRKIFKDGALIFDEFWYAK